MKIGIITNGSISDMDFLKMEISKYDYIICADGAAKYLKTIDVYPDLLVGDLDSINSTSLEWIKEGNVQVERFPVRKDMTDTELAIEYALGKSPGEISIIGAVGSRIDHSMGNIMLLYKINKLGINCKIVGESHEIMITSTSVVLNGSIGDTISIIPIGGDVSGVTLEGLEYPLNEFDIPMGSSMGISNTFARREAIISLKKGTLLIIKTYID